MHPQAQYLFLLICLLAACGGGGGGSGSAPPPAAVTTELDPIDATPSAQATQVDVRRAIVKVAHLGFADVSLVNQADCTATGTARRSVTGLSGSFDALDEHYFDCTSVGDNQTVGLRKSADRGASETVVVNHQFTTAMPGPGSLMVLDTVSNPLASVQVSFQDYLAGELFNELGLPFDERLQVIAASLAAVAEWTDLSAPQSSFGALSARVSYPDADPAGNAVSTVTGLLVRPDTGSAPLPREEVILLAHSTGSTPGDLDPDNPWYLLANLLASYGYLVVAPDNWGRGDTADQAETYLLGARTAQNNLNLLRAVLADPQYAGLLPARQPQQLVVVGYSQGGHTAAAILHQLQLLQPDDLQLTQVFAGGGPYNLYATFAGVMQHLADSCDNNVYCRDVDDAVTVPFATNRILPGYLSYTTTSLVLEDIVVADQLTAEFVDGFVNGAAETEALKTLLQLNSYSNLTNAAELFADSLVTVHLYHAGRDRLVASQNQADWLSALGTSLTATDHSDVCNGSSYDAIAAVTDVVGVIHSLCGIAMMDDVVSRLR